MPGDGTNFNPFCGGPVMKKEFTVQQTIDMVAATLLVLRVRDGLPITTEQANERAGNLVQLFVLLNILKVAA